MENNVSTTKNAQDAKLERELLGMMITRNGACIPKVEDIVTSSDFQFAPHQKIYRAILQVYHQGIAPSNMTLVQELKQSDDDNKDLLKLAFGLKDDVSTDVYAESYAKKIREKSLRLKLSDYATEFAKKVIDPKEDFAELVTNAESNLRGFNADIAAPSALLDQTFYFSQFYTAEIKLHNKYAKRKTGFFNIDGQQIFSPGLYVIGATPACGKTTFSWQLLNQLSTNYETCIFCSYEMSRLELYTKTLARELFLADPQHAFTAAEIRSGSESENLETIFIKMANGESKAKVSLLELHDETIDDLLRMLKPHCKNQEKPPVVCIDYLQIVPPSESKKLISDKARVDDIVRKLKTFQRETNTTFIVVSSFNRMNYYQQVSFESFKDSGNIEYTADVVWAMQLNIVNELKIGAAVSETRKKFDDAKKQQPRQIQLKCLKNRQGQNYDCYFNYYSAHDYFEPCELEDFRDSNQPETTVRTTPTNNGNYEEDNYNNEEET